MRKNLIGSTYNFLTVIDYADDYIEPNGIHQPQWLCRCICNKTVVVRGKCLKSGDTKSCGCMKSKIISESKKKKNTYDLSGEYGIGYTEKGECFYFDLSDYNKIKDYYWRISKQGYIVAYDKKNHTEISMHQLICGYKETDHIDGKNSKNDNRKQNLRSCSRSQNNMNKEIGKNNKSGYKGVVWNKKAKAWQSQIGINNKTIYLGCYKNIDDAVKAREEKERELFKEFSVMERIKNNNAY